jgi:hypothetical protein
VVEVEHHKLTASAIDTLRTQEQVADEGHVAPFARKQVCFSLDAGWVTSPRLAATSASLPVAVDADDFASRDLLLKGSQG